MSRGRSRTEKPQQHAQGEKRAGVQHTRDQTRAKHAYRMVNELRRKDLKLFPKYRSLVNGFGAGVMRSGLVAALAFLARKDSKENNAFAEHLGSARIPGLQGKAIGQLIEAARELPLDDYMLATRETLRISVWFRRAVQAADAADKAQEPGRS